MNCQFYSVQLFNDAKQLKKQLIHALDAYFNSLKIQFLLYMKKQKRIYFFTKLKPSIKIILTNYQNLFSIKKNLLSLTARLKNNIKMKKKIISLIFLFNSISLQINPIKMKNQTRKIEKKIRFQ